jgi:hypothetical protein
MALSPATLTTLLGVRVQANYTGSEGRSLTCVGTLEALPTNSRAQILVQNGSIVVDMSSMSSATASLSQPSDPH